MWPPDFRLQDTLATPMLVRLRRAQRRVYELEIRSWSQILDGGIDCSYLDCPYARFLFLFLEFFPLVYCSLPQVC